MIAVLLLSACQKTNADNQPGKTDETDSKDISWTQNYDSEDTGVLIKVDENKKTLTIKKIDSGQKFLLNYSGATNIINKYENALSIKQVNIGEIINVYYNQSDLLARKVEISPDAWEYTGVENLTFDRADKIMYIAGKKYQYGDSFTLTSNGKEIDLLDLNPIDVVTVKGFNKKICSIIVTKGHGYISLKNDDTFMDGWIDVGQEISRPIAKDMFIVTSEGNHKVTIAKNGSGGTKSITVKRNEETIVDVGDLKSDTPKYGSLKFTVTPTNSTMYIDGVKTDYSEVVVVEYGIHRLIVKADGYMDYVRTIVVGSSYAEIEIDVEKASQSASSTSNSTQNTNTNNNKDNNTVTTNPVPNAPATPTGINTPGLNKAGKTGGSNLSNSLTTDTNDTSDKTDTTDDLIGELADTITDVLKN